MRADIRAYVRCNVFCPEGGTVAEVLAKISRVLKDRQHNLLTQIKGFYVAALMKCSLLFKEYGSIPQNSVIKMLSWDQKM